VLDDAELRRGAPTTHVRHAAAHRAGAWRGEDRRYGEGVAILAGDLAFAYADRLTTTLPPAARAVWAELAIEMITGQYLDITVAARSLLDPALARYVAVCKSGHYSIHRPLVLGATVAGRHDLAAAFAAYGVNLGEAFQLRDDLIDAFGTTEASGKPAGLDFDQQKMTFLLAVAMERDQRVRELVDAPVWDAARLRALLLEAGVRDELESHIARLVAEARRALDGAPLPPAWRDDLGELAFQVAYRDR
jgi:geranylgeranyl diphosphate synthase type I